MLAGVTVVDPATTWIEADVEIEADAVIQPFTVLRGRTRIGAAAEVALTPSPSTPSSAPARWWGRSATCGRERCLHEGAKAGTFVEVKGSTIGADAKVPHLSYIGDAEIGEGTNIGAGAITANYRAERFREKQRTVIGRNVHTGSQMYSSRP